MIIGIDINVLTRKNRTGTERYVFELIKEMMKVDLEDNEQIRLYSSAKIDDLPKLPTGWEMKIITIPKGKGWTHLRLSLELLLNPPDIFFSPAHEIPLLRRKKTKILSTVHDVAFHVIPKMYPKKEVRRQEWSLKRTLRITDKILTISQATAMDLIHRYNVSASKIAIAHLAPTAFVDANKSDADVLKGYNLDKKGYFFTLSRIEKKKNILNLVKAYSKYRKLEKNPKLLVLGGKQGFGFDEIEAEVAKTDGIIMLGFVPDNHVKTLMSNAKAYLFPTWYEGFGMPVLESQIVNTPLIAANIPAIREVAGDSAILIDPDDIDGWAIDMAQVDEIVESFNLEEKAKKNLARFSWKKTSDLTWKVIREL